ncbi:MAG TPA: glycosyltransferase family 9 protein [Acidocella sp.]|nr:glycosyltransferase family 9 protein [Acidocella sp.]
MKKADATWSPRARHARMEILVIKLSALGDFVLAFPAMAAIRAAHPQARISLLTTAPFVPLALASGWFDHVDIDRRPKLWNVPGLLRLRRQLRGFDLVYDLQTSGRSSRYFTLAGRPAWSGIAKGCSLPHADPNRVFQHSRERLAGQLHDAGIFALPVPDLSWAKADITKFNLPERYTVLVPGAAAHRPEKRWPTQNFAALAQSLDMPVAVVGGSAEERRMAAEIGGIDLTGRTSLLELAAVMAHAALAIGNDTGPMHLAAALGTKSVVLFSGASDPKLTAPRYPDGGWPVILREARLADLPVAQVRAALP